MKALFDSVRANPIAATSIVAALIALPNLEKGMAVLLRWYQTPSVAEAAMQKATETDQEFEEYLRQQREALKVQQAYADAQQAFAKQLMDQQQRPMTQQAVPNAPPPAPIRYWDQASGAYYCCAADDPQCLRGYWWCS